MKRQVSNRLRFVLRSSAMNPVCGVVTLLVMVPYYHCILTGYICTHTHETLHTLDLTWSHDCTHPRHRNRLWRKGRYGREGQSRDNSSGELHGGTKE